MDYSTVKAEDLELVREPKRSAFAVKHVPTDTIGTSPVIPGTTSLARYHSPSGLPKEERKGLSGYIASVDKGVQAIYKIPVKGDNEYFAALAADPEALKLTFEGVPKPVKEAGGKDEVAAVSPEEEAELMKELDEL